MILRIIFSPCNGISKRYGLQGELRVSGNISLPGSWPGGKGAIYKISRIAIKKSMRLFSYCGLLRNRHGYNRGIHPHIYAWLCFLWPHSLSRIARRYERISRKAVRIKAPGWPVDWLSSGIFRYRPSGVLCAVRKVAGRLFHHHDRPAFPDR